VVLNYDCLDYLYLMNVWFIFGFNDSVIFSSIKLYECSCVVLIAYFGFFMLPKGERNGVV